MPAANIGDEGYTQDVEPTAARRGGEGWQKAEGSGSQRDRKLDEGGARAMSAGTADCPVCSSPLQLER